MLNSRLWIRKSLIGSKLVICLSAKVHLNLEIKASFNNPWTRDVALSFFSSCFCFTCNHAALKYNQIQRKRFWRKWGKQNHFASTPHAPNWTKNTRMIKILRVVQTKLISCLKSMSVRVGSYIERFWILNDHTSIDFKLIESDVIEIQTRSMLDPPLTDIGFKNIMAWVWTTLNHIIWAIYHDGIIRPNIINLPSPHP